MGWLLAITLLGRIAAVLLILHWWYLVLLVVLWLSVCLGWRGFYGVLVPSDGQRQAVARVKDAA